MRIWHDHSYVGSTNQLLIQSGFAKDDIYSIRLSFSYTKEEQAAYRERIKVQSALERNRDVAREAQRRSDAILAVVKSIAEHFICYQFDKDANVAYGEKWDLFFWCNDFYNTAQEFKLSGRDYSYVTLTLNDRCSVADRQALCARVLDLLTSQFSTHSNLDVAVQHSVWLDQERIDETVEQALPRLMEVPCSYAGMEGKIVQTQTGVFFVKKRCRKRGYRLSTTSLLAMAGCLSNAAAECEVQDA